MEILRITGLKKCFGDKQVLGGLDLVVEAGSVYGFVGPNGAGKTTTMKAILGLLHTDSFALSVTLFAKPSSCTLILKSTIVSTLVVKV